ncbi:MAG: diacylglycerol kinase family lipid kinase [Bacteroidales bacterium]|nr:diacylglycerol kinase family lipid kinase [Bacteroidales bacterium]
MKKYLCIYNPQAGGGKAKSHLEEIKSLFVKYELIVDIVFTEYPRHSLEIIKNIDLTLYAGILVAGGDGSFFNVLNGFMALENRADIPFGILPIGTGNSLVREVIDGENPIEDYIKLIKNGKTKAIDIAQVKMKNETFYYANMMGFGFISDVNVTAPKLKMFKAHAYTLGVLYQTIKLNAFDLKMTIDGVVHNMKNVFVIISNSKYTGGNYLIAPKAELNDGKLDLIILNKLSRINLLKTFPKIFDGSHVDTPFVDYIQAKSIKLETNVPKTLSPDGEVYGEFPAEVSCIPAAINLFA